LATNYRLKSVIPNSIRAPFANGVRDLLSDAALAGAAPHFPPHPIYTY
jgi:hypothetical protein